MIRSLTVDTFTAAKGAETFPNKPNSAQGILERKGTSMFCVHCGLELSGRFCAGCGTPVAPIAEVPNVLPMGDWQHEVRYAVLLRFPEVRDRLAEVPESAPGMAGEEWLGLYDKAFKPFTGVSVQTIASIAAPIYAKLGIKTGKSRADVLAAPPGRVMVEVLCALARHGLPLVKVQQGKSGCVFEAKLPSDLRSLEGHVIVTVERTGAGTKVEAATNIPGQLFDWGKSTCWLENLFGDLRAKAA
jgi:hypothetical protein